MKRAPVKSKSKTETKALVPTQRAVVQHGEIETDVFLQDSGSGMQSMEKGDLMIPFLAIVQSNSPEIKKNNAKYIRDASEGDIFNTASRELYDSVDVVPCYFEKVFIEWRPRDEGGGFVARHDRHSPLIESATRNKKGRLVLPNGNELRETAEYYVLVLGDDVPQTAVISMCSTQLKKSRRWNTLMSSRKMTASNGNLFTPPTYAFAYTLTTVDESNDQGDWKGWEFNEGTQIKDMSIYRMAKAFHEQIAQSEVNMGASYASQAVDEPAEEENPPY